MSATSNYLGEFNARCLTPEEVAQRFVMIPQFHRLLNSSHSILLGPRGSGKTTLLKMLTTPALDTWEKERQHVFKRPDFESIYIPSDIRWSYELNCIADDTNITDRQAHLLQRVMVTASVLIGLLKTFEQLTKKTEIPESDVCILLIEHWKISGTIPLFLDIKRSIRQIVSEIRAVINFSESNRVQIFLEKLPPVFYGHILDIPISSCLLIQDIISTRQVIKRWALCFDELEIAPEWLRNEILESLRSVNQSFLLKLTWSPLLPTGLKSAPEPREDYVPIRLWHSHITDARTFCENLTTQFLKNCFPELDIKPDRFFSSSLLGQDDKIDKTKSTYERGSTIYKEMKILAEEDLSFNDLLVKNDIDPTDPYTEDPKLKDRLFRKIKPIVLIRRVFLKNNARVRRSRKAITLYAGKEAIYAMSEANPRWLLGLLSDLHDRWAVSPTYRSKNIPYISYPLQAKTLNSAARRYEAFLSATAAGTPQRSDTTNRSLLDYLREIGNTIGDTILGDKFPLDPFGSFYVDEKTTTSMVETVKKAVQLGALIYVGKADTDVPNNKIIGERFRLTFMLSPIFKLPLRNYRGIALSSIFDKRSNSKQMNLFDKQK